MPRHKRKRHRSIFERSGLTGYEGYTGSEEAISRLQDALMFGTPKTGQRELYTSKLGPKIKAAIRRLGGK